MYHYNCNKELKNLYIYIICIVLNIFHPYSGFHPWFTCHIMGLFENVHSAMNLTSIWHKFVPKKIHLLILVMAYIEYIAIRTFVTRVMLTSLKN